MNSLFKVLQQRGNTEIFSVTKNWQIAINHDITTNNE